MARMHAPLVTTRCDDCGAPTETPRFAAIGAECLSCGENSDIELPTHGSVRRIEIGVDALLGRREWGDALRRRDEEAWVIVGACRCKGPLIAPAATPLGGRCHHCQVAQSWRLGDHVVDALPASTVRGESWGGGLSLRFAPALLQADVAGGSCPGCGAPLPAFQGHHPCGHCGLQLSALLTCGRRFLVGFRVQGDDDGQPVDGWVPISQAIDHYAARKELLSRSRWSTLRGIGGGFLAVLGAQLLILVAICGGGILLSVLPAESRGGGALAVFGCVAAFFLCMFVGFFVMLFTRFTRYARDRDALLGQLNPLPVPEAAMHEAPEG